MAIAGRVAIVPKGEWSQDVTYDKLDLVTRNGNTFIAYKSSVGVEPVDGDTWMLIMQGIDPQEINNIINGTTPVGKAIDADTVDGYHASAFRKACVLVEDAEADLNNYTDDGVYYFSSTTLTNAPVGAVSGWLEVTHLDGASTLMQKWQERTNVALCSTRTKSSNTTWRDWVSYLPLNGGTINGALKIFGESSSVASMEIARPYTVDSTTVDRTVALYRDNGGALTLGLKEGSSFLNKFILNADGTITNNGNTVLHTGNMASHVLPLSGGTVNGNVSVKQLLEVFNTYSNLVHIRAKNNSHSISMHVSDAGNAGLYDDTHSKWLIKSDSNGNVTFDGKPTGTYTGTGKNRTITIGTKATGYLISGSNGTMAIVAQGAVCVNNGTLGGISSGNVYVKTDGSIYMASTDATLNASGVTYTYVSL